ncbi:major facilitator superfamily domain-containing protein [Penicillium concentricum]|uniref:Major facilitator superfamily domain-containing protein n=1 Tax=Penicillium concentricum TaxID=293559 RepID=A0A9W9S640_9EURO|nr:major facilitator superfamily domain-containing protein [Penicillium concentricum]KAJ5372706.1 major facilitator superfamily domain-containing protein [Penicillium concentricum]
MSENKDTYVGHPTIDDSQSELKKTSYTSKDPEVEQYLYENLDVRVGDSNEFLAYTQDEERQVKRKIDWILLPLLCMCYVLSFLDKTLLNYSSIFGLKHALHLEGSDYSWLGSVFYIGYMVGSMVWSNLVRRWPQHAGKFISGAVFTWSCITLLTPLCVNFAGMVTVRLCLGLVESIIGPVFVIVTSNWWTRPEQAFRTAFWLGGTPIGNFFGRLISYALGSMHPSFPTWKLFFVFFGALSFAFSFVLIFFMPDNQANARWLSEKEKKIAITRVRENNTASSDNQWKWTQFWEALRDPQTILFFITAVGNTMPSTFASQFSSQVVQGFGFSTLQTTLVSTCPAAVIQLSTFLVFSYIASHHNNIRLWISIMVSIPPLIGASLLHSLPQSNQAGRLAGYYLTYTHSMSFTLNTGLMASNYAGNTKKSTANGIIFAGWAAGLVAGPQFFLESEAPAYMLAFKMLMGCYALMVIIPMLQLSWYKYENRRRDQLLQSEQGSPKSARLEFTDKTDFEQWETFRYTM